MSKYFLIISLVLLLVGGSIYFSSQSKQITANAISMPLGHQHHMSIVSEQQFIEEMIPHHQEAVDSSKLMLNSENVEVRSLAGRIIQAQEIEIANMNSWHNDWFPKDIMNPSYTPMMPSLENFNGQERDRAFLMGMIGHHEMAVNMANQLLELKPREELRQMGNAIIETQNAEIQEMKEILKNY